MVVKMSVSPADWESFKSIPPVTGGMVSATWTPDAPTWSSIIAGHNYGAIMYATPQQKEWVVPPHQCPHCNRDRHDGRLTENVAYMFDTHSFRADYIEAEDDSATVCVGSDYIGPATNYRGYGSGPVLLGALEDSPWMITDTYDFETKAVMYEAAWKQMFNNIETKLDSEILYGLTKGESDENK